MSTAWIFAGQGAEEPGMGLALAARDPRARAWLDEASRATGIDVPRALERGARALTLTEVLQPVLVAVSLASADALSSRGAPVDVVAGHSLGELSAACWASSVPMRLAIDLAALRGALMSDAARAHPGGMLAVPAAPEELLELVERGRSEGVLQIAAINARDETVIAGDRAALAWLTTELRTELRGRATPLRVAGAWHTERMRPAVAPFAAAVAEVFAGRDLRARVVSAARGAAIEVDAIGEALASGLVSPVRFLDAVSAMEGSGVDRAVLVSPSRTTRSLFRRASARGLALVDADDASIDGGPLDP